MPITESQSAYVEAMIPHYVIAGLWATPNWDDDQGPNHDCLDQGYGPEDMSYEAMESIRVDCANFVVSNWADLEDMDTEQAGHDFLLTRDGHGAGFWDRGLGAKGDRLTEAAQVYGDSGFYAYDGQVHVQ